MQHDHTLIFVLQVIPGLVAVFVLVGTVFYFLLGSSGEKTKKLPVTLQDPTVKYPLPLIRKEVGCIQTYRLNKIQCVFRPASMFMINKHVHF